jgi:4-amino-4-deoxy-L-arabinose transferase-like glycosyltransferase
MKSINYINNRPIHLSFSQENKMNHRRIICFNLFIFFLALYILTAPGRIDVYDAKVRYNVTYNLIETGELVTEESMGLPGKDGRYYSWYGLGQSLLAIPFYILGKWMGNAVTVVSLINPLIGAFTCVVIFRFCTRLGYSHRASLIVTFFYGLGTFAWPYAKMNHDGPITTLFTLLSVYCVFVYHKLDLYRYLVLSSFALGAAVLTRFTSFVVLPVIFIFIYFMNRPEGSIKGKPFLKEFAVYLLCLSPFIGLTVWYNDYRFGSVFETGYSLFAEMAGFQAFSIAYALEGLPGFLLSPNKSYFLYSPVALLFFFSIRGFHRQHKTVASMFLGIILSYLFFYSSYRFWHGDWAWGPRYLLDITPFLLIPLTHLFDETRWKMSRLMRQVVYVVFIVSIAVQIIGTSVNFNRYFHDLKINHGVHFNQFHSDPTNPNSLSVHGPPKEIYFDFQYTPIAHHFEALLQFPKIIKSDYDVGKIQNIKMEDSLNAPVWPNLPDFWWVYAGYDNKKHLDHKALVFSVLLLLCIILISFYRIYYYYIRNNGLGDYGQKQ